LLGQLQTQPIQQQLLLGFRIAVAAQDAYSAETGQPFQRKLDT
jgi:hypothetical protein